MNKNFLHKLEWEHDLQHMQPMEAEIPVQVKSSKKSIRKISKNVTYECKEKKLQLHVTIWINLTNSSQNEESMTLKNIYRMTSLR